MRRKLVLAAATAAMAFAALRAETAGRHLASPEATRRCRGWHPLSTANVGIKARCPVFSVSQSVLADRPGSRAGQTRR